MLEELVETLCPKFECKEYEVIKTFKGKEFEYITCTHPLYPERESLLMKMTKKVSMLLQMIM